MRRPHALAISILLGLCAAGGAAAALGVLRTDTGKAPRATRVAAGVVAARAAKLDAWSASLRRARRRRPPTLPSVPHFAPVAVPAAPQVVPAAAVTPTRHVRKIVRPAPSGPAATLPEEPQEVTYVESPPIVRYQQAPTPAAAPPTVTSTHESDDEHESSDDGYEGHDGGGATTGTTTGGTGGDD